MWFFLSCFNLWQSRIENEHYWGEPERAPHKRYFNARSVYIYFYGTTVTRAPLHRLNTKAAYNVFGWRVCVVKTTATFCSNIAHITIFPSWSATIASYYCQIGTRGHVVSLTGRGRAAPLIDTTARGEWLVRWRIRHRASPNWVKNSKASMLGVVGWMTIRKERVG